MVSDQIEKMDVDPEKAKKIKDFINLARGPEHKVENIVHIPDYVVEKASLISAHLLLPTNAEIVDVGCCDGKVTYAMALLNPLRKFIGIDHDRKVIAAAREAYKLPNLEFRFSDARIPDFDDESVDGIINSNVLHEIYSASSLDPDVLEEVLDAQIKKLRPGGMMLVRDYMKPPIDEYVLLELPDVASVGNTPQEMSYADLLIEFSQTARPMEQGCEGFFLEELDPSILKSLNPNLVKKDHYEMTEEDYERLGENFSFEEDKSRVFRLLHKWAIEFIHRKDERDKWDENLGREFTFYTYQGYRAEFAKLGMRMLFSAPYRNPWVVDNFYNGRFRLYNEDARRLPPPATNYFVVAQKIPDKQSLILEERRPSQTAPSEVEVITVRDNESGVLHELARRPGEFCDIVPYRFTDDGRLLIYVRSGYPRPIINAVMRGNSNLDDKQWSGHLIEPITMNTVDMTDDIDENKRMIMDYVNRHALLDVSNEESFYVGMTYFPSPDRIDEAVEPVFVEVGRPEGTVWRIGEDEYTTDYKSGGVIMELDANDVIRAAQVGLLPEPRLEIHVFDLMMRYGIEPPPWVTGKLTVDVFRKYDDVDEKDIKGGFQIADIMDAEQVLDEWQEHSFSDDKASAAKHLKAMRSVFVEEGKTGGAMRGIASQDYEFVVTEDGVENIAVVYPLTRGWDDSLMMGVEVKNLPVPQRLGGSGATITAPSFVMPRSIRTIEDAKIFVGEQFGVGPDRVWKLGESYFTHTSMSPQRVYPFVVAAEGKADGGPDWEYHAMKKLWILLYTFGCFSADLVKGMARMQMQLGAEHAMSPERSPVALRQKDFELSTDKTQVSIPGQPHAPLSRVMGQRGGVTSGGGPVSVKKKTDEVAPTEPKKDQGTPEADRPPVSLEKKTSQKLTIDFNNDENENENEHEGGKKSLKNSYKKAQREADMEGLEAPEGGKEPSVSEKREQENQKRRETEHILRATRPDPN